jgi:uncharacterized protein involved in outer membrane biogenesis
MKKLVIILGGVVVVVLGGAVAVPHMIDWNKYKPRIQSAVADFTGYEVNLAGDIDMAVLPFPHVVIENVGVKIPGAGKDIVGLKKAEVSVALMPLFSGEVSVSSVNLVDPVINLVVDKDGRKTWMTEKMQASNTSTPAQANAPAQATGGGKFALNKMKIENGTLNYTDATGKTTTLEQINTTLSADSLSGPFKASGDITYNKQKISAEVKTGRIDDTAKTVSVDAQVKLPGDGMLSYAGVVGTAGGIDLQGETKISTDNISAMMTAISGDASTLPPVAVNIQGIVTAKDTQADIKTLKVGFGDFQALGSIGIRNLKAQEGPAQMMIDLTSNKSFKLESLLPGKSVKTVQAAPDKDAGVPKSGALKSFLPDNLKLPVPVDVQGMINLAGVSYKGAEFGVIKIGVDKKGGVIALTEDVGQIPGGGTINGKSTLTYAGGSQGADKSGVVYSDPSLAYSLKMNAKDPAKLLGAFLPEDSLKSMQQVLKDPIVFDGNGTVRGAKAGVDAGTLTLGQTILNLGSTSYTLDQTGKNDVALTVSGQNINLDAFMGTQAAAPVVATPAVAGSAPAAPAKAAALEDTLKKIDLPVDLAIKADLKNVTMQGTSYAAVTIDGGLSGNNLSIKTASMQDPQGNVMQVSGGVKDIHSLTGVDVTLSGKTADANAFLKSLKVDPAKLPKDIGPLDLAVSLTGDKPDSLSFNAKAKVFDGDASANGILLRALSDKPAVDKLAVSINNPNFEKLFQKFSPDYKAGVGMNKSMNVTANVNLTGDGYDISALTATLGSMTMTGSVKAKTGGAKPDITATFNAGTVPLDVLLGKDKTTPASSPGTSKVIASSGGSGERWSRDPIDASALNNFDLDLKLNAKSIQYNAWDLSNTVLAVTVKDGTLNIAQMDAGVYGGTMSLTSTIKTGAKKGDALTFETKSDFKNVGLEALAQSFGGGTKLVKARGNVSLSLNAKSSGTSPATLVGGLNGSGQLDGKSVVLQGFDLAAMSRSLVSTGKVVDNITGLATASFSGGETAFDKIDGPFTIASGNVTFDKFLMTGPTATITNKGSISLPRWYIDMVSSIDLVEPEDAPNLDMKFQGSLDNPGNAFGSNAMQSYIQGRVNKKLQSLVGDKLGDKNPALNNLVNGLLGGKPAEATGGTATNPVVKTPATTEAVTPAATAPAAGEATPAPAAAAPAPAAKATREEKINNVLQGIMGATQGH